MHSFGVKRFGDGIQDDFRSFSDQNTRIVGDFTKSVLISAIVEDMAKKVESDTRWIAHFAALPQKHSECIPTMHADVLDELKDLGTVQFERERLQVRFFELGDNYYLGMELPREFDSWKNATAEICLPKLPQAAIDDRKTNRKNLQKELDACFNRLWYEATTDVIHRGDVYNPSGRQRMPRLYMIDSSAEQRLGDLDELDEFRLHGEYTVQGTRGNVETAVRQDGKVDDLTIHAKTIVKDKQSEYIRDVSELNAGHKFHVIDRFEILSKGRDSALVRTSRGHVREMPLTMLVKRSANLSRAPNGYDESKVALASFPVGHVISHRTMQITETRKTPGALHRIGEKEEGFITTVSVSLPHSWSILMLMTHWCCCPSVCWRCPSLSSLHGKLLE